MAPSVICRCQTPAFTKTTTAMTTQELLDLLNALKAGTNPLTAEVAPPSSPLRQPSFQEALGKLIRGLHAQRQGGELITDVMITDWTDDLLRLDYQVTPAQLAKVLIGSRTVVAPNLLSLPWFGKYSGVLTRKFITGRLANYHAKNPGLLADTAVKQVSRRREEPWREVAFFEEAGFDQLTEEKATELFRSVEALGLRKPTEEIPDYQAQARQQYPRSFEPWTREEKSLLIEAMCYTNDAGKLRELFGRSDNAIRSAGKRLIWESQNKAAA